MLSNVFLRMRGYMSLKNYIRHFVITFGILSASLSLLAQENSQEALRLASEMEKAKDIKGVISVLREVPRKAGLTDRLMVYDRIPKHIVDTEQVMEIVRKHVHTQPDVAYASELIYALELDAQLKKSLRNRKDRAFIRNVFFDSIIEWRDVVVQTDPTAAPVEVDVKAEEKIDAKTEEKTATTTEKVLTPYDKRAIALAKALAEGMTVEQRMALLKYEVKFQARNNSDSKIAVTNAPRFNGSKSEALYGGIFISATFGPLLSGGGTAVYHLLTGRPGLAVIESILGLGIGLIAGNTLETPLKNNDATRESEVLHLKNYYNVRATMLDAFFGEIKTNSPMCARSVTALRVSGK